MVKHDESAHKQKIAIQNNIKSLTTLIAETRMHINKKEIIKISTTFRTTR